MQKPNPDNVISFYIHNNPLTDIDFTSPSRLYTTPYTCYCAGAAKIAYLKKKKTVWLAVNQQNHPHFTHSIQ
jgi:hypothetical protein